MTPMTSRNKRSTGGCYSQESGLVEKLSVTQDTTWYSKKFLRADLHELTRA